MILSYETVIGLEVHAQLLTQSKIFCGCSTTFGAEPNTQTCPICLGMPGVLPVVNRRAIEFLIRIAVACEAKLSSFSQFARKNYFYPDLPKNYQISQYDLPLAIGGHIEIPQNGETRSISLVRIHLEEDAGKLIHGENMPDPHASHVDLNRTGVPLLEIVSMPELRSPAEAREYLTKLRTLLQYLEICDGNMEEGSLRCDANVSVRPKGSDELKTKTEIKNLNSFRHVQRALEYESDRQIKLLEKGGTVAHETRLWDVAKGATLPMRTKEQAHDYRYFTEPDLVPLVIDKAWVEEIRSSLPELPDAKRARFITQYSLPPYDAALLTTSRALADYYEECVRLHPAPKTISNWVMGDLLRDLKAAKKEIQESPVTPQRLTEMIQMVESETISGKIAKTVFEEMFRTGKGPQEVVAEKDLVQITDEGSLIQTVEEVLAANPTEVDAYRAGKEKLLAFFMGQVMKQTAGKANPKAVQEILRSKLSPPT